MGKKKKKYWICGGILVFAAYLFLASRPVPEEFNVAARWISSLEDPKENASAPPQTIPFELGTRFGYVDPSGGFTFLRNREGYVSLSGSVWAEYGPMPESIEVKDPEGNPLFTVLSPQGYPAFLGGKTYIVKSEQNSVAALDEAGKTLWTYDFDSPLTSIAANGSLFLAGTLGGIVELIDSESGKAVFSFDPGGSRVPIIISCAISRDGTKLALVSGVDEQRFLLMEKSGDSYRVAYHESLGEGYRRPLHLDFIGGDNSVVFEKKNGVGVYDIKGRNSVTVPLDGEIHALDPEGGGGLFFIITKETGPLETRGKNLVAASLTGRVIMEAPFKSGDAFLGRTDSRLYIGGGTSLISFDIGTR